MSHGRDIHEKYQPHWLWVLCFFVIPLWLTGLGFFGVYPQDLIPLRVASLAPRLAVFVALIGLGAALLRRRRVPIAITGLGLAASLSGFLLLLWLT